MKPSVRILMNAKTIQRIQCGECNWELEIAANTDAHIQCCPWCGWSDLDTSYLIQQGGFQEIECEKHGKMTILVPDKNINPDDFMDDLYCPYC